MIKYTLGGKHNSAPAANHVLTLRQPAPKHCNEMISEKKRNEKKEKVQKRKPTKI
jgi:hypothetical protein